ncbi:hypothetical protein HWV62_13048 [Athelia sp. TMB]|nr:hypothetical protein HWV62_13048 [Athelia sp. TMB]
MYGRRPIYLCSMPIFIGGSIGVAESRTLIQLIFTRMIQGIGASSVLSVGAGSIGDIYRPTERGRAMGLYLAGAQLGPPLAPVIGGIMTEYAHGSRGTWRAFQYLLAAMGLLTFVFAIVFLPETSHSRGIDEMKAAGRKGFCGTDWVWLNPLRPLGLLRFKHVLAIGPRFGITNSAILGTLYLAQGGGNIGQFITSGPELYIDSTP